jgi:hypothetical protein
MTGQCDGQRTEKEKAAMLKITRRKRHKADVYQLGEMPLRTDAGEHTLVESALANLANALDTAICLKEPGDGLLDWPPGSIVGQALRLDAVRKCPLALDIRPTAKGWEFLIPEVLVVGAYCMDADIRGVLLPEPIHPNQIMDRVREFFRTRDASGWVVVLPEERGRALAHQEGTLQ